MSPLRYSLAVILVATMPLLAHAQTYTAKQAAQGTTSDGLPQKKLGAKAALVGAATKSALAQPQPAPQPTPSEKYNNTSVQGTTSDGPPQKKLGGKAALVGAAANSALAQQQPAQQPNPPENYNNASAPAERPIPPRALSQVPATWAAKVQRVPVPDFSGMTLLQVQQQAVAPGGKPLFLKIYPQSPLNWLVIKDSQSPRANTMVVPGRQRLSVRLTAPPEISKQAVVPSLKGLGFQEATASVQQAHLRPVFSGETSDGVAGDPSPPSGTIVDPNTAVTAVFALPPVLVPPLTGMTLSDATQQLAASFLQLGTVANGTNTGNARVALQSPEPLTPVERGTPVNVTMEEPPVAVPDVTKNSCAQARSILLAARLRPAWNGCPPALLLVNTQVPISGTKVAPQSLVSVFYAPVVVPPLVGLPAQTAADRLSIAGLNAVVSAPPGWDPAKSTVKSQFPEAGVLVDVGSDVSVEMRLIPWWERMPWWGWVVIGLTGFAGLGLLWQFKSRLWHWIRSLFPPYPPVVTLRPDRPKGKLHQPMEGAPKVRLTLTLRDRIGKSKITSANQPAVREMEMK